MQYEFTDEEVLAIREVIEDAKNQLEETYEQITVDKIHVDVDDLMKTTADVKQHIDVFDRVLKEVSRYG